MKRTEIGSEFWYAEGCGNGLSVPQTYLCGRAALSAVLQDMMGEGISSVYLPDYCCESMIEPMLRLHMRIGFYRVRVTECGLSFDLPDLQSYGAVLLVNFFGFQNRYMEELIRRCRDAGVVTVLDQTHCVLNCEDSCEADYCFGSFRKWTGLEVGFAHRRDGKLLVQWPLTDSGKTYLSLRQQGREVKQAFVEEGYLDEKKRQHQLSLFGEAEELLDVEYLSDTDAYARAQLARLDPGRICRSRQENAAVIYEGLRKLTLCRPVFSCLPEDGAVLAVPVLVEPGKRDSLRTFLRQNGIFCPVHWPLSQLHDPGEGVMELYQNELSLICDQRYSQSDIRYMMEIIQTWEMQEWKSSV